MEAARRRRDEATKARAEVEADLRVAAAQLEAAAEESTKAEQALLRAQSAQHGDAAVAALSDAVRTAKTRRASFALYTKDCEARLAQSKTEIAAAESAIEAAAARRDAAAKKAREDERARLEDAARQARKAAEARRRTEELQAAAEQEAQRLEQERKENEQMARQLSKYIRAIEVLPDVRDRLLVALFRSGRFPDAVAAAMRTSPALRRAVPPAAPRTGPSS